MKKLIFCQYLINLVSFRCVLICLFTFQDSKVIFTFYNSCTMQDLFRFFSTVKKWKDYFSTVIGKNVHRIRNWKHVFMEARQMSLNYWNNVNAGKVFCYIFSSYRLFSMWNAMIADIFTENVNSDIDLIFYFIIIYPISQVKGSKTIIWSFGECCQFLTNFFMLDFLEFSYVKSCFKFYKLYDEGILIMTPTGNYIIFLSVILMFFCSYGQEPFICLSIFYQIITHQEKYPFSGFSDTYQTSAGTQYFFNFLL